MDQLPNELKNIIKDYVIYKPKSKNELKEAVDLWCTDKEEALKLGLVDEQSFDKIVKPENMVGPK